MVLHIQGFQRVRRKGRERETRIWETKTIAKWSPSSQINKYSALPRMFRNLGKEPHKEPCGGTILAHQVPLRLINPTFPWVWKYYWVTLFFNGQTVPEQFLRHKQLLWRINQRGQFCPQNPVKQPSQNKHNKQSQESDTQEHPQVPVPSARFRMGSSPCPLGSINPHPYIYRGQVPHEWQTSKGLRSPLDAYLPGMYVFWMRRENSKSNLFKKIKFKFCL